MKANNTIEQVRKESSKITKKVNNLFAVIVLTQYSKSKFNYGIQYWSDEMISRKVSKNEDNTTSIYCELL